ncbi:MAG: hypothetical protein N4A65_00275 [Cohaesibacter sp.]|jgi:hypothetical protein|nr:hypothetical protein [Cohaesibacter sp.]
MIWLLKYWRPLLLISGIAAAFIAGWVQAGRQCRAEALQAKVTSLQNQLDISRKVQDSAVARSAEREKEKEELERQVEDYETALANRIDPSCALSVDDARRLQQIK